ncbi:MAG TPA: acyl-CoA-binding protein, partial [Cytophagales bacterium]|nr:acyl-CoA-binding protein [Cytophagales bacterium]
MEELSKRFEEATIQVKSKSSLSNDQLLKLYSLYKQSTIGDNNSEPPSNPFDFVGKAKYEAWEQLRGIAKTEAMQSY